MVLCKQQLLVYTHTKEGNVLFNDAFNTFYLWLYGIGHMVKDHSDSERGNPLPHIGYSFRLAARVLLYASSHRQDNTYNGLCYTSRGALAGTENSSMGPPHEGILAQNDFYWAKKLIASPKIRFFEISMNISYAN